jgi:hypothetical protein
MGLYSGNYNRWCLGFVANDEKVANIISPNCPYVLCGTNFHPQGERMRRNGGYVD